MLLDLSISEQTYIEDCEICCRPIKLNYTASDLELEDFSAENLEE